LTLRVTQSSSGGQAQFKFTFTKNDGTTSIIAKVYIPSWIDYKPINEKCIPEDIARVS
jgi:hypothetical protein